MSNKISQSGAMSVEDLIVLLSGLIDGLKAGRILIEKDNDFIVLFVSEKLDIKIETKVKHDKAKLALSFSWPLVFPECIDHIMRISDGTMQDNYKISLPSE